MATLELLQNEKIKAIKNKNEVRKLALSDMIDAIQKASITPKGRLEITEDLVNETLIKHQKIIQEMIDTCPEHRIDKLIDYKTNLEIVKEFAPQIITDETLIEEAIRLLVDCEFTKKNKGKIMKTIMPAMKGKYDGKVVASVLGRMLEG